MHLNSGNSDLGNKPKTFVFSWTPPVRTFHLCSMIYRFRFPSTITPNFHPFPVTNRHATSSVLSSVPSRSRVWSGALNTMSFCFYFRALSCEKGDTNRCHGPETGCEWEQSSGQQTERPYLVTQLTINKDVEKSSRCVRACEPIFFNSHGFLFTFWNMYYRH